MQKTVAVLGASQNRSKFGNKSLRAHAKAGYEAFPVNLDPSVQEIEGLRSYRSLEEIPKPLDRITLYLPPPVTLDLLPAIAEAGAEEVWLNPGSYDGAVLKRAKELNVPVVEGCSIVDLGMSPADF